MKTFCQYIGFNKLLPYISERLAAHPFFFLQIVNNLNFIFAGIPNKGVAVLLLGIPSE